MSGRSGTARIPWIDFCRWLWRTDLSHSSISHGTTFFIGPRITFQHNKRIQVGLGRPIERRCRAIQGTHGLSEFSRTLWATRGARLESISIDSIASINVFQR
jgi:hypothetical protein